MKLGIVGLPNVGKSTLFNSLTKAGAESANYPFCTIDPNVGIVAVPDERLKLLGDFYHSKKVTPAVIEFVDIAGLVKGASKGEGLGNQFLANIREVDAIVHVVRCFEDENVVHVDGSIDPMRDIETINLELIFSDLEILERRIAKTTKTARMDKDAAKELEFLKKIKAHLEDGKPASTVELEDEDQEGYMKEYNLLTYKPVIYAANVSEDDLADDAQSNPHVQKVREYAAETGSEVFALCAEIEQEISELEDEDQEGYMKEYNLLTYKPVIYAANVSEDDLADDAQSNPHVQKVREYAAETGSEVFALCAEIEQEISELEDDEKKEFLEDLGIKQSGLEKLIVASYRLLGLLSFLTSGEDETRAWTIKVGTKAPQAAGKIHSDF